VRLKEEIIGDLVSGRVALVEAASRFRQVGGRLPTPGAGADNGEAWCRAVIGWAHLALEDRPERADAISEKLEQELQSHLSRFGAVHLSLSPQGANPW
jgi:hypothetical protein